jgi:hypothetical protein
MYDFVLCFTNENKNKFWHFLMLRYMETPWKFWAFKAFFGGNTEGVYQFTVTNINTNTIKCVIQSRIMLECKDIII